MVVFSQTRDPPSYIYTTDSKSRDKFQRDLRKQRRVPKRARVLPLTFQRGYLEVPSPRLRPRVNRLGLVRGDQGLRCPYMPVTT